VVRGGVTRGLFQCQGDGVVVVELAVDRAGRGADGDGDGEAGGVEGVGLAGVEADELIWGWGEVEARNLTADLGANVQRSIESNCAHRCVERFWLIEEECGGVEVKLDQAALARRRLVSMQQQQKVATAIAACR